MSEDILLSEIRERAEGFLRRYGCSCVERDSWRVVVSNAIPGDAPRAFTVDQLAADDGCELGDDLTQCSV